MGWRLRDAGGVVAHARLTKTCTGECQSECVSVVRTVSNRVELVNRQPISSSWLHRRDTRTTQRSEEDLAPSSWDRVDVRTCEGKACADRTS